MAARPSISAGPKTRPDGLCGVLTTISFVFAVTAAAMASSGSRQPSSSSFTPTARAPMASMIGR